MHEADEIEAQSDIQPAAIELCGALDVRWIVRGPVSTESSNSNMWEMIMMCTRDLYPPVLPLRARTWNNMVVVVVHSSDRAIVTCDSLKENTSGEIRSTTHIYFAFPLPLAGLLPAKVFCRPMPAIGLAELTVRRRGGRLPVPVEIWVAVEGSATYAAVCALLPWALWGDQDWQAGARSW